MRNSSCTMRRIFFPAAFIALLAGCRPEENPGQLMAVNQSLERVNNSIKSDSRFLLQKLLDKEKDPQTAAIAEKILPIVNKIHLYTDSLMMMIENIKSEIITQSDTLKREYVTIVKQLYTENGIGSTLFKKLSAYKDSIPAVLGPYRPTKNDHILKEIPLLPGYGDSLPANDRLQYGRKWQEKNFERSSSLMAMVILNKIENDVLTTEKMLTEYCNSNYCILPVVYNQFKALAVLSSSYVEKGQPIEITAGVGEFSTAMKPRITIDGKPVALNANDGTAVHRFTADGKPGKHNAMVRIEFTSPDGSTEYISKRLEYIIADEK